MRKITETIVSAFLRQEPKRLGNTKSTGSALYLHGNKIAEWCGPELWITNANWPTPTTKDRLNALPSVRIHQHDWQWYLNGRAWDGDWTRV